MLGPEVKNAADHDHREDAHGAVKHGDSDVKVTIKAADDAAVGTFTVMVTGHPREGPDATSELKLKVEKK